MPDGGDALPGKREHGMDWDAKVAFQRAYADMRADALSERFGFDVKKLPSLSGLKPRRLSTGAMAALRSGAAVLDDAGFLRCPPGTPNAMEFTDFLGSNCGVSDAAGKPIRLSIGNAASRERLSSEGIGILSAADVAAERIGRGLSGPQSRRARLLEGARNLLRPTADGEPTSWQAAMRNLSNIGEGFSFDMQLGENATSGFAIARPGRGIRIKADELYDENGEIKESGAVKLARMIAVNAEEFTTPATVKVGEETYTAERVVLGGWHSDKDGYVYFDVTDVFSEDIGDMAAFEIGKERNQQSVAVLSRINSGNYEGVDVDGLRNGQTGGFIDTQGTGGDLLPDDAFFTDLTNAVRMFGDEGPLEEALRAIGAGNSLDLDNFTPQQIATMLGYLQAAPGFAWTDPDNPDHLYLALMQLSDNLMFLMDKATPEERRKYARWYDIANTFNRRIAERVGVDEVVSHAVTAVLSPQKDWNQNTAMSEHLQMLMSDGEYVIDEAVGTRAFGYAYAAWMQRNNPKSNRSHDARIARIKKAIAEDEGQLKKWGQQKQTEQVKGWIAGANERIKLAEIALEQAYSDKESDVEPALSDFVGRKIEELSDFNAATIIRAHSELEGGAYLGQPEAKMTKDDVEAGKSPRRLLAYDTITNPDDENPGDHSVEANPEKSVSATSLATYVKAVRIFRSGGDPDIIDIELGNQPKVRSFNNNMKDPGDLVHRDTTIDTHAIAGELLTPISANHLITDLAFVMVDSLGTGQAYPVMRAAMIAAALRWEERTGEKLLPRQIQSITWEVMRTWVAPSQKKFVVDRIAQINRLGTGPDALPSLSGPKRLEAIAKLLDAASVDLKVVNEGRRAKDRLKREDVIRQAVEELGLPPLEPIDILPRAKKKGEGDGDGGDE